MSESPGNPAADRPKRARIELLVRAPEGKGFETREIPSALAYLQSRPQRVPDPQWEIARLPYAPHGVMTYALKNRRNEQIIQITEAEKFLWEQMDGHASLQEIATAYLLRYGSFDFEIIPTLIVKLRQADLLTMRPVSRLRAVLARNRRNPAARAVEATLHALEKLTVTSRRSHDVFKRIYRYGGFLLFSPAAVVALVVVVALGGRSAIRLWNESGEITHALGEHALAAILLVKLCFWLTVVSHQIIHALACVHYHRRVREFGFTMLHGFIPTFYADVTDIFMATRRARIVNALAGPLVHLFLGFLCFWIASLLRPGLTQGFLAAYAILQIQSFFVSLYPFCFLEMDGYHILVELLGVPTLNHDAVHFVREGLWRRIAARQWLTRQETICVGYFVLSLVSVVGFVLLNVWVVVSAGRA
ncbi:MAG TPA: M50 family metallopeptidase [Methylomirabilota bacterium]|nr:M50 family metallopeptidase [Methylomirabilota bacterium]